MATGLAGKRSDSEAAFQEFLKRIPSASALSSQNIDDKQGLFGSTNSLFGAFGNGVAGQADGNIHKVASLDMLRTLVEQRADMRPAEPHVQEQLMQAAQNGSAGYEAAGGAAAAMTAPAAPAPIPNMPMQMPAPAFMAYQPALQLGQGHLGQGGLRVPGLATAAAAAAPPAVEAVSKETESASPTSHKRSATEKDKIDARRARRMLSNRESARRSRKRKQEQLAEYEARVDELSKKTASLESQCQAAAVHVQKLMADKQRLESENQHLVEIFAQLQKRLGKDTIRMHLPPALGGALDGAGAAAAANGDAPLAALGTAPTGSAPTGSAPADMHTEAEQDTGELGGKRVADDADVDDPNGKLGKGGRRGAKARRVTDAAKA